MSVFHMQQKEVGFAMTEVVSHHPAWEPSFDRRVVLVGFVEYIVAQG
jgi:hypothetical protein